MTSHPIGVLIAQLGTPDAPTPEGLRRYLRQFLSDMRVVDLNPLVWHIILRLGVLRKRPARSAAMYRRIWTKEGSPLLAISRAQMTGLQKRLGDGYRVLLGMRYGNPSIGAAIETFEAEGIERIVIFPMFPQFSSSTTASVYDAVTLAAGGQTFPLTHARKRTYPTLRFVPPYYDHPGYIAALKTRICETVSQMAQPPDYYLFSFHGIPQRYAEEGDPYSQHCQVTAERLAEALELSPEQWSFSFQSRFGREVWLQPYTDETLADLGAKDTRTLLAACPGFTTDCLETVDEIGNEGAKVFCQRDDQQFILAPSLNDHPAWLDTMVAIVRQESAGWSL